MGNVYLFFFRTKLFKLGNNPLLSYMNGWEQNWSGYSIFPFLLKNV